MSNKAEILAEIISNRRSIYPDSYIKKEIAKNVIEQILESANYAPTHKLTQPWRFTVITGNGKKRLGEKLGDIYKTKVASHQFLQKKYDSFGFKTKQAPVIIAINMALSGAIPEWEELAATACAVQNMGLTAESLNIGAYWSSPALINDLGQFLGLKTNEKCVGLFYMGYHEETQKAARRDPIANKVTWLID